MLVQQHHRDNAPLAERDAVCGGRRLSRQGPRGRGGADFKHGVTSARCVDTVWAARPDPARAACPWERLGRGRSKVGSDRSISAFDCESNTQPLKPTIPLWAPRLRQGRRPGRRGVCARSQSGKCGEQSPRGKREPPRARGPRCVTGLSHVLKREAACASRTVPSPASSAPGAILIPRVVRKKKTHPRSFGFLFCLSEFWIGRCRGLYLTTAGDGATAPSTHAKPHAPSGRCPGNVRAVSSFRSRTSGHGDRPEVTRPAGGARSHGHREEML